MIYILYNPLSGNGDAAEEAEMLSVLYDPEGKVSLTVLHGSNKLKALALFPLVFKGKSLRHSETVSIHTGHDIRVTFDRPTSLLIDGEAISDVTEYGVHSHIF